MWKGFGIGMADIKTVGPLKKHVDELMELFEYFEFDSVYAPSGFNAVVAKESNVDDDIVSYDYDAIYKKIDEVLEKIKGIDSGSDSFLLSDEETKRIIDNALMTMFGCD